MHREIEEFVPQGLRDQRFVIIPPAIDPLSSKNMTVPMDLCSQIVEWNGVRLDRLLITQVSRFDPWKDPLGVIEVYQKVREAVPDTQLALLGQMALVDHRGKPLALSDFRGKVAVLAFLDPKCTDVCPLTANEFRLTAEALENDAAQVVFLVVNVNPAANSVAQVSVTTVRWGVQGLQGWRFLTGSREDPEPVYREYHIEAEGPPKPGKADELQHTPGSISLTRMATWDGTYPHPC
jgi:cytochrome oxidase Cu insertion factor (SCO1/SenC/PrrC family)